MAGDNYGDAIRLSKQIVSFYEKRNVPIEIDKWDIVVHGKRYKFRVIFKKRTKIEFIRRYSQDAQFYLELALFQVVEEGTAVYIVASRKLPKKNGWRHILESQEYSDARKEMGIAHPVGIDVMGNPVISDLIRYPHAVVAGTTRSGKSVALKSLLLNLVCMYSPLKVNLLIGDGASDLQQFSGLPHLSYPVIDDGESFFSVVLILKEEMERRIEMKQTDEFKQLPSIIFVIDEFSSFVSGNMKDRRKLGLLTEAISELLRRGRHAKIHLILAVHNPTKQNMRIDMGDIPVKLVFRVSNVHNSVTVLGEGGAEKLKGEGDMYFYQNGQRKHLFGTYISEEDTERLLEVVKRIYATNALHKQRLGLCRDRYSFKITENDISSKMDEFGELSMVFPMTGRNKNDSNRRKLLYAKVILWTLGQTSVSCNRLCENFKIGWSKANDFLDRMQRLGIVDELDAKLPRTVLLNSFEEVPEKVMDILQDVGISIEDIFSAMDGK